MAERHCLLLHGFTGGPYEVLPLAEHLEGLGYVCHVPTLPGHGEEFSVIGKIPFHHWLDSAAELTERLTREYGEIDLVGFSMGGLLSMYLANRYPVRRLVLLSAAAIYVSPVRLARDMAYRIRIKDWEQLGRVKRTPFKAAVQFMKLVRLVKQQELRRVTVPTLIVQGKQDHIVHPRSAHYIYRRIRGERELYLLEQSKHMICTDPEAQQLFHKVEQFLVHAQQEGR
ncbi:alpha/beta hydrolase [Paenibacillus silviterrae]|uniref:alpha/beta hydrolase n=1 Tax=Paenibacillus silviterrae TaxID=3242194 RepID=UPI002542D586|nr:alpha/beta fold hydrolase [Paenibacillus chinjuensis]